MFSLSLTLLTSRLRLCVVRSLQTPRHMSMNVSSPGLRTSVHIRFELNIAASSAVFRLFLHEFDNNT